MVSCLLMSNFQPTKFRHVFSVTNERAGIAIDYTLCLHPRNWTSFYYICHFVIRSFFIFVNGKLGCPIYEIFF